jgi:serine phosphatase RsbU (regulator of sigma subunit)
MTASPGTHLLLIEDSPDYALLVEEDLRLTWHGELRIEHFLRLADARAPIAAGADCVLLDLSLPDANELAGLGEVLALAGATPVVVLTGQGEGEGVGAAALRLGAQDYLVKSSATGEIIARSVRYAIERRGSEIERHRLEEAYSREAAVAEELRRGLVPGLPDVPGLDIAARYEPSGPTGHVGGDWYDVLRLPDGRVGLAMGDVAGHGLAAAALMGQLSSALRAHALTDPEPEALVDGLDAFLHHYAPGNIATLLWAVLDPRTGATTIASAGHPPALLVTAAGEREWLRGGHRALLGAPPGDGNSPPAEVSLHPGDTLLLYTDGLVERRGELLDDGLARLSEAARGGERVAAADLADHLLAEVAPAGDRDDDVALLAVRPRPR